MKKVITISREFGSGGRTIAKALAERLGYKYYDKELVQQVADETGFDPAYIEETGEFSATRSRLSYIFPGPTTPGVMRGMSASDFLWCIQKNVILKLADEGNCVIVGRCADYILRERDDVLNVFIHASLPYRCERVVKLYGDSEKAPEVRVKDKDKRRFNNYKHYTGQDWGDSRNYHLSLDSGVIGIDRCVDIITELCK